MFKKSFKWAIIYSIALVSFTLYAVLDTFVIPRTYAVVGTSLQTTSISPYSAVYSAISENTAVVSEASSASVASVDSQNNSQENTSSDSVSSESVTTSVTPVITDNSYQDANISITITQYREYDTDIYVADVQVSDVSYLKTAFAQGIYGRNVTEKTSTIAAENNAILAINGDYYGAQNNGYVLRNGVLYRSTASDSSQQDLVIYADGSFGIITEGQTSAQELLQSGAIQVLSFGPALIENGSIAVSKNEEVDKAMTCNPRTAICMIDNLHYLLVVADGRTSASTGLSLYEMAQFLKTLGVQTAYNLDGGGSSTMVFNGEVINNPTTNGNRITERSVSDIVCIGY
ncbi:MAG TPA: phosphodiester glycosidase family protein [Oscillospiraceae bacterium]|nr:phosphodiester glycosidase family protein [Oscillospiraceae bacterium]HPF56007.1 phosphodiester glycosidase family protein [Clostridiales bacterium]HPK36331.1 phosphodiester glycosidase family protein [Oscillospiraceae bacterium]